MTNNIYDTANQLERDLREHPSYIQLKDSYAAITNNSDSKLLFDEFRQLSLKLQEKQVQGEELSPEEIEELQALSAKIMEDDYISRLMQAEQQLSQIMNDLNNIITKPLNEIYQD